MEKYKIFWILLKIPVRKTLENCFLLCGDRSARVQTGEGYHSFVLFVKLQRVSWMFPESNDRPCGWKKLRKNNFEQRS